MEGVTKGIKCRRILRVPLQLLIRPFLVNIVGLEREQVGADAALAGSDYNSSPFGAEVADMMPILAEDALEPILVEPLVASIVVVVAKDVGPGACLVVDGVPEDGDEEVVPLTADEGACIEIFLGEMESDDGDEFWEMEDLFHGILT